MDDDRRGSHRPDDPSAPADQPAWVENAPPRDDGRDERWSDDQPKADPDAQP